MKIDGNVWKIDENRRKPKKTDDNQWKSMKKQGPWRPRRPPWRQREVAGLDACIARILLLLLLMVMMMLGWLVAAEEEEEAEEEEKEVSKFYISQLPIDRLCGCYWYINTFNTLILAYINILVYKFLSLISLYKQLWAFVSLYQSLEAYISLYKPW